MTFGLGARVSVWKMYCTSNCGNTSYFKDNYENDKLEILKQNVKLDKHINDFIYFEGNCSGPFSDANSLHFSL